MPDNSMWKICSPSMTHACVIVYEPIAPGSWSGGLISDSVCAMAGALERKELLGGCQQCPFKTNRCANPIHTDVPSAQRHTNISRPVTTTFQPTDLENQLL